MNGFEIGGRISLAVFIPPCQHHILPCDNIGGLDFRDFLILEIGKNLLINDAGFHHPGVELQALLQIPLIKLHERFKGHVQITGGLVQELALPLQSLPLCGETALYLAVTLALPVGIVNGDIPLAVLVLIRCHPYPPFALLSAMP